MIKRGTISTKDYVLFSMYSAPVIDIINNLSGSIPIGPLVRALIVTINVFLIALGFLVKKNQKKAILSYLCCAFFIVQTVVAAAIYSMTSLQTNIIFFMKIMLFVTEVVLLRTYIDRGKLTEKDFQRFWKYSSVIIPLGIIVPYLLRRNTGSLAGLYTSTNAMSVIVMMNVLLAIRYAGKDKILWFLLLLNLVGLVLLGTKSVYFLLGFSFIAIMFLNSKHKLRFAVAVSIGIIAAYFIISRYFASQWRSIFIYQTYGLSKAQSSGDFVSFILSGRNVLFEKAINGLKTNGVLITSLFVGVSPYGLFDLIAKGLSLSGLRGVELDPLELLFSYGMIVTLFVYSFFFSTLFRKVKGKGNALIINLAIGCTLIYSFFGGHAITEAISATYCGILLAYKHCLAAESNQRMIFGNVLPVKHKWL